MLFKRPKRLPYGLQILFLALSLFLSVTLLMQMRPLYKSFSGEEFVFFGSPSFVSEKRWVGNRVLPILDAHQRLRFCLNGDQNAVFDLFVSEETFASLAYWFPFVFQENGLPTPGFYEVRGIRIAESEWVVTSIRSSFGVLEADELFPYHLRSAVVSFFWGTGLLGVACFFLMSLCRAVFCRKKNVPLAANG